MARAAKIVRDVTSWAPIDLGLVIEGGQVHPPPSILAREDGWYLFYLEKIHRIFGPKEVGKGWLVLLAVKEQLEAGAHVIYLDFEDDEVTIVERLHLLGVADDLIRNRFHYVRPDERFGDEAKADLDPLLELEPSLVVFDGQTEALMIEGIDIIDNTGYATWLRKLPRYIRDETGAAVVLIDHVSPGGDSRKSIGAQHKGAGIDAEYQVEVVKRFGRGVNGESKIFLRKDRPGHMRRHARDNRVGTMEVTAMADDSLAIVLKTPEKWVGPTKTMEEVSAIVAAEPGLSQNAILQASSHSPKTTTDAIRILIADGYVRPEDGPRRSTLHYSIRPYVAPPEDTGPTGFGSEETSGPKSDQKRGQEKGTSGSTGSRGKESSQTGSTKRKRRRSR